MAAGQLNNGLFLICFPWNSYGLVHTVRVPLCVCKFYKGQALSTLLSYTEELPLTHLCSFCFWSQQEYFLKRKHTVQTVTWDRNRIVFNERSHLQRITQVLTPLELFHILSHYYAANFKEFYWGFMRKSRGLPQLKSKQPFLPAVHPNKPHLEPHILHGLWKTITLNFWSNVYYEFVINKKKRSLNNKVISSNALVTFCLFLFISNVLVPAFLVSWYLVEQSYCMWDAILFQTSLRFKLLHYSIPDRACFLIKLQLDLHRATVFS